MISWNGLDRFGNCAMHPRTTRWDYYGGDSKEMEAFLTFWE